MFLDKNILVYTTICTKKKMYMSLYKAKESNILSLDFRTLEVVTDHDLNSQVDIQRADRYVFNQCKKMEKNKSEITAEKKITYFCLLQKFSRFHPKKTKETNQ